ncbi:MAG: helix-turn-helix transcriptional regulator [Methylococcaceae bacterium]
MDGRNTGEKIMSKADNEEIPVLASSGNLFADLERPDAEEALARVRLAQQIAEIIVRKALSQEDAAALMELDPPKFSALVRGRLSGFSTDRLLRCLILLGQDVDIVVRDNPGDHPKAHISVITVTNLDACSPAA